MTNEQAASIGARLQALAAEQPDFTSSDAKRAVWLGRLNSALEEMGSHMDGSKLRAAGDFLDGPLMQSNITKIQNVLYRALAQVEPFLPLREQGAFIAGGNAFDAITALGRVLGKAEASLLVLDPYMSAAVLESYLPYAPEGVQIQLLADSDKRSGYKPCLLPAAKAWVEQYGDRRPLQLRFAPPKSLHDRMIIVDGQEVWDISQSLNALAKRAAATISKSYPEIAIKKIEAYSTVFEAAEDVPI